MLTLGQVEFNPEMALATPNKIGIQSSVIGGTMQTTQNEKVIRISVAGAENIPLDQLEPFQGDLKRLDRDDYERLRKNLIENGFSFTIHVWKNGGKNYIIDGHQRLTALKMMRDNEQWVVGELPVSVVEAEDFPSAKKKILAGISTYGKYTEKTLFDFIKENDIPFDGVVSSFSFPEINMEKFTSMFGVQSDTQLVIEDPPATPKAGESSIKSGSDGVKQVQLFFDAEDYNEFMEIIGRLKEVCETENITDTILWALRETNKTYIEAKH